mmetsp:Transcript_96241/g.269272  ORF Transcript_96241/g.269272 Transcript_96241/m.269272 type:complete len:357 (+) Transcript_96241:124-1194(+)
MATHPEILCSLVAAPPDADVATDAPTPVLATLALAEILASLRATSWMAQRTHRRDLLGAINACCKWRRRRRDLRGAHEAHLKRVWLLQGRRVRRRPLPKALVALLALHTVAASALALHVWARLLAILRVPNRTHRERPRLVGRLAVVRPGERARSAIPLGGRDGLIQRVADAQRGWGVVETSAAKLRLFHAIREGGGVQPRRRWHPRVGILPHELHQLEFLPEVLLRAIIALESSIQIRRLLAPSHIGRRGPTEEVRGHRGGGARARSTRRATTHSRRGRSHPRCLAHEATLAGQNGGEAHGDLHLVLAQGFDVQHNSPGAGADPLPSAASSCGCESAIAMATVGRGPDATLSTVS